MNAVQVWEVISIFASVEYIFGAIKNKYFADELIRKREIALITQHT